MTNSFNVAVFNGDGIGPEVMGPTVHILAKMSNATNSCATQFCVNNFEMNTADLFLSSAEMTAETICDDGVQTCKVSLCGMRCARSAIRSSQDK